MAQEKLGAEPIETKKGVTIIHIEEVPEDDKTKI